VRFTAERRTAAGIGENLILTTDFYGAMARQQ